MFDTSNFICLSTLQRLKENLIGHMAMDTYRQICIRIVGKTMVIGLKGDKGRAVTVQVEDGPSGPFSLCGYPVSGKAVFDCLKATGLCPQNDSGGPVIGLDEAGVLEQLLFELF